jgi:transcriptional regulator with XRE-family HTH domain
MRFSLGKRLRNVRESLGLTQEQVIEQLEDRYSVILTQQAVSCIENGKRKVDAERELPALAGIYGKSIDYFYENLGLSKTSSVIQEQIQVRNSLNLDTLSIRDKLELVAEIIHNVLQDI